MGAFFGFYAADKFGSWPLGLVVAMLAGAALAAVHAFFCIHLRADQIVVGTGINFLALGITGYAFVDLYGDQGSPTDVSKSASPSLDFLGHIPDISIGPVKFGGTFLQSVFGDLNWMIWLSFLVLILTYIVLFRTSLGLRIRAVGEHPRAADTVGISVYAIRYGAVITSGALAALGGAYLSVADVEPVRPEPHGRARVHRHRRDHLRQLAAVRRLRCVPAVRLLERARRPPARVLRPGQRHAAPLQHAAVRADPDRGRRCDRPLDPSRLHRPSVRQAVACASARPSRLGIGRRGARLRRGATGGDLLHALQRQLRAPARSVRDPGSAGLGLVAITLARSVSGAGGALSLAVERRAVARRRARPRRSSGCVWPRRRSWRSVSTDCSSTSGRAS